jgi:hypothetical protein
MDVLYKKSLLFDATDFGVSKRYNKRFYVKYDDKILWT